MREGGRKSLVKSYKSEEERICTERSIFDFKKLSLRLHHTETHAAMLWQTLKQHSILNAGIKGNSKARAVLSVKEDHKWKKESV